MPTVIRNDISNRYNVDSNKLTASENYVRNLARNVTGALYRDILANLKSCLKSGCKSMAFETSVNIKNNKKSNEFYLDSFFYYRVTVKGDQRVISFQNLKLTSSLRGMGVLTGVLRQLEPFCDANGVTIEVTELGNLQLAMYLGTKRGYDLYSGVYRKGSPLNKSTLNKLTPLVKKHANTKGFVAKIGVVKEMGKNKPEYAIRKPKK